MFSRRRADDCIVSEVVLSTDESTFRTNLSYVMHERSDSRAVRQMARVVNGFCRHRDGLRRSYERMTDQQLADATLITPRMEDDLSSLSRPPATILTVHVGLPELLARVMAYCLQGGPSCARSDMIRVDGSIESGEYVHAHLFRAQASLARVARPVVDSPVLVAVLAVRPGSQSLQLAGRAVSSDELEGAANPTESPIIRHTLETIIRDHVDQWYAPRPLWDRPAELGLDDLNPTLQHSEH